MSGRLAITHIPRVGPNNAKCVAFPSRKCRQTIPVRSAEGTVIGQTGGRAAGREGLQGSRHIVAIQRRNAGAIGVRRAGCRRPWDIVARWSRTRTARRRGDQGNSTWRHVVTLVYIATPIVDGVPHVVAGVSS